ncbi:serine/threonine-protein kinase [Microtetraspora malaysiensis]|uniref:serine/threonine-protein kinase n=1 Tax=Microtetraspora malaysiensis TaxID=161358 RepID=UPI003D94A72C
MNQDDRLGPYRLLRRLGEGGMGVVHLALDPHGRQVAIKVLRPEVTQDDLARRRLSREVETMRRVRSPHIAEVLDADVTGRRPYIVTRYVPGRPLDELVKQDGPLPVDALLRVGAGVAEALAAVHGAGVIHRDLKPGNVLMLDGRPVLIDFGIAQGVDATRLTQTGMFIGTPGYLAPEIIEGHEAGPEVDVHAWGGTLLYAATGLPPFGKGTLEMIFYNITSGKANVSAAPALIQPVLRAALQRNPARRPTAADLSRQVTQLMPRAGRVRVPDEISTVPNVDETTGRSMPVTGTAMRPARPRMPGPRRPPTRWRPGPRRPRIRWRRRPRILDSRRPRRSSSRCSTRRRHPAGPAIRSRPCG